MCVFEACIYYIIQLARAEETIRIDQQQRCLTMEFARAGKAKTVNPTPQEKHIQVVARDSVARCLWTSQRVDAVSEESVQPEG